MHLVPDFEVLDLAFKSALFSLLGLLTQVCKRRGGIKGRLGQNFQGVRTRPLIFEGGGDPKGEGDGDESGTVVDLGSQVQEYSDKVLILLTFGLVLGHLGE